MPRAGLTPAAVVAEAGRVADESGLEQLTLASVAQRLGVALPSLYKHVNGIGDLRRLMAVSALHELDDGLRRAVAGKSRGDALRALAQAYWEFAHRHPGRYAASLRAPARDDAELAAVAADLLAVVQAVLAGYGIEGDDATDAIRTLRAVLHGFVALQAAGGFGMPREVKRSFERAIDALDTAFTSWA